MIQIDRMEECCGCGACEQICPKSAIKMKPAEDGCLYPDIDIQKCVQCNLCDRVCPVRNKKPIDNASKPHAYAAYCLDSDIRKASSSGGIFTVLAQEILQRNGIVIGAALNENREVAHILIEHSDELYKLRGSKYVQSRIGSLYVKTKEILNQGRTVLFTGTPCEISGLLSFLGKPYPNLYTQDLICHGSPAPALWEKYVNWQEANFSSQICEASFRHKGKGWTRYSMRLSFQSRRKCYTQDLNHDPYLRLFLSNLYLRPSCYECAFKTISRNSDFTLADFWGWNGLKTCKNAEEGVSLILVHTEKGQKLLKACAEKIWSEEVDVTSAIRGNTAIVQSAKRPPRRGEFLQDIKQANPQELVKKYLPPLTLAQQIRSGIPLWLLRCMRKLKSH